MLRVHLMQNRFRLSDPAMEEAPYETGSMRSFAALKLSEPIPDETTILNFRNTLEEYDLAEEAPRSEDERGRDFCCEGHLLCIR